jgi:hypothetical protein
MPRPSHRGSWPDGPSVGHEIVAAEDPEWRLAAEGKRCRRTGREHGVSFRYACGKPAVAELNRARTQASQARFPNGLWWPYCAEHLYGRWIEDGKVMHWIQRRLGAVR